MSDGDRYLIPSADPRLGRHVNHDPRSRMFPVLAVETTPTRSVRHRRYGAKLNQGYIGGCTGWAGAHCLNTDPVRAARRNTAHDALMRDADGLRFYEEATNLDSFPGAYPPDDTGSDGLSVCKAMLSEGIISRYETAFGFAAGLSAISVYSFMQGTYWTENMMGADADGRVHPTGKDVGGHEYVWNGVEIRSKLTPSQNRSWFINQWGEDWGVSGYFYMTWGDHEPLLARDGDLIRPVV